MLNTHHRRRRDSTASRRRVGVGVGRVNTLAVESVWSVSKLSTESVGSRRELVRN